MSELKNTKAVLLPGYNDNLIRAIIGLKLEEVELPTLQSDEVLVKMFASPCNPSDIAFLRGRYNIKKPLPAIPGFEASGVVVKVGDKASELQDQRICCFTQEDKSGTWAEHFIAKKKDCIVLKDLMEMEQAACFSINPLTAYGLFEMVLAKECKAIVQNAAGGQVAQFIRVLAKKNKIEVINVVRKEEHVKQLLNEGEKFVLNSSAECFQSELTLMAGKLNAQIAIDVVGGEMTALFLNSLPSNSIVVVYGGLSGESISGVDTMGVIFQGKSLLGFNLNDWIANKSKNEFQKITDELQDMFISGELRTEIHSRFLLDDAVKGIRTYIKSMSAGKVLFVSGK